jgi:hypothetical protein
MTRTYSLPWELASYGEADGDGRVHVRSGDVANGVDHDHDSHPPHHGDPRESHRSVLLVVHYDGGHAGEQQEERGE